MSFATFYYLPVANSSAAPPGLHDTSMYPRSSSTSKSLYSASSTTATTASDVGVRTSAPRRPLRVTREALPELLDILIRAVDFQLPAAQHFASSVAPSRTQARPLAKVTAQISPDAAASSISSMRASQSAPGDDATQQPASGSGGLFSRYIRSPFFGHRGASTPSTTRAVATSTTPAAGAADTVASAQPASLPSGPDAQSGARDVVPEPAVTRFYLRFPTLQVASRPDAPTTAATADTARVFQRAEGDETSLPAQAPAQRVASLIRRARSQAEAVISQRLTRQHRSARAVVEFEQAAAAASPEPRSPSLRSQHSTDNTVTGMARDSPPAGAAASAPVAVPLLRLPTSPAVPASPLASSSGPTSQPPRLRTSHARPRRSRESDKHSDETVLYSHRSTAPTPSWTVACEDPWQTALRRPGPDEVALELRIRAFRTVTIRSDGTNAGVAATGGTEPKRARSMTSAFRSWLSPVVNLEPARPVPLAQWVVPIIQVAHSGVTFLELDPYSHVFLPVSTAASARQPGGAPTRKLFCDNDEDVRRVLDFIMESFYDALALETFHLQDAAAQGGPGAVAEIQLDVHVVHKKSF